VSVTETPPGSADLVRAGVAAASRQRRICETTRQFWRTAPIVAGLSLGLAVVGLWTGWTVIFPLGTLALGFAGLTAYTIVRRRDRSVTDPVAAAIDRDADLGGELRSAAWFAGLAHHDMWAGFHLDRAAARLDAVNWTARYSPARAGRPKLATAVMVIATVGLAMMATQRRAESAVAAKDAAENAASNPLGRGQPLPADLEKQLADLLAAAEAGSASSAALGASAELREFLAQLAQLRDSAALKELAHAIDTYPGFSPDQTLRELMALAERTRRASETPAVPPDIRDALEKLSEKLSVAASEEQALTHDPDDTPDAQSGELAESDGNTDSKAADSIQSVKDSDAGAGAAVMMMSDQDASGGGAPGLGSGGGSSGENGGATMPGVAEALVQETVEASADSAGQNVLTDTRRKTEHGRATVTYTQGAPGTFDRSRAAAPPPVPEGRRSAVQTYFIRKP
jgi:hypothetical protein